jgi:hypothetical protein
MKALGVTLLVLGMLLFVHGIYVGIHDGIVRRSIVRGVGGPPLTGRRALLYGMFVVVGCTFGLALFAWPLWVALTRHVALW